MADHKIYWNNGTSITVLGTDNDIVKAVSDYRPVTRIVERGTLLPQLERPGVAKGMTIDNLIIPDPEVVDDFDYYGPSSLLAGLSWFELAQKVPEFTRKLHRNSMHVVYKTDDNV